MKKRGWTWQEWTMTEEIVLWFLSFFFFFLMEWISSS